MKIQTSSVNMQSTHQSYSYVNTRTTTVSTGISRSFAEQLDELKENYGIGTKTGMYNRQGLFVTAGTNSSKYDSYELSGDEKMTLLEMLLRGLFGNHHKSGISGISDAGDTVWTRVSETQTSWLEAEDTSFAAMGTAVTSDGRTISFNMQLGMSRRAAGFFQSTTQEQFTTDPLVINIDAPAANISDQKFYFDLDSDGKEEEISFAGYGSGFLALDKNGDGVINNGSELFGTKSGDGFADLSEYDEDGNGWIDESDSVFDKLKVWTVDADGQRTLLSLKQADVGAIYLGRVGTEFSLKDADNNTDAIIRSTGMYLKESGGAGTVQQVDLVAG